MNPPATGGLAVLHADAALVVVDKPAGLLCVPGRGADKADCLATRVQTRWPDALVVHRLDMATSGIVVFARGAAHQRALSVAFAERRVAKGYEAVVQGALPLDGAWHTIEAPLAADWPNRPRQQMHAAGKPSTTRWRVLAADGMGTRLALEPVTGRTHQLRVHLAHAGHPILGDPLYGDAQSAPRLLLHACSLALAHPGSGAALAWQSPVPF